MSYYTALTTGWNLSSGAANTLPSGVTGTPLFGLNTANKMIAVNSWTLSTPQPATFTVDQIRNAILYTDFLNLTSIQLQQISLFLGGTIVNAGTSTNPATIRGVFGSIFANAATTLGNFGIILAPFDGHTSLWVTQPIANGGAGLNGTLDTNDLTAAGLT